MSSTNAEPREPVPDPEESRPEPVPPPAEAAPGEGTFCPSCGMPLADGAVLCTDCGFDLRDGGRMADASRVSGPPRSLAEKLPEVFMDCFPGFYRPWVIVMALLCAGVACFLGVFTAIIFGLGAYLTAGWMGVVALAAWAQAVAFVSVGRVEFLKTALADMEGTQFSVFLCLVFAPPVALGAFLGMLSCGAG
ncbi:MAG: zinc-ribbon domain-containing protein [Lentisphaeria bacterium]|nr:zinc-ribbon domain-containing protein [Lentisphaeria bacterium]